MSRNKRVQSEHRQALSLGTGVTELIEVERPREAEPFAGGFEGEKVNRLTEKEVGRREGLAGKVSLSIIGALEAADVFVERLFKRKDGDPFRPVEPLFPTEEGDTDPEDELLIPDDVGGTLRPTNDADFQAFIESLTIRGNERLFIQLRNDNAGTLAGTLVSEYDLGRYEGDIVLS